MRTLYDEDIDYLEVVEVGIANFAVQVTPVLLLFLSESDRTVVGFALDGATKNLKDLDRVPPKMRLTGALRLLRGVRHLNQEELAKITKIGTRTLQRAEAGDANLTFDNLISLVKVSPKVDFSILLRPLRKIKV
jgi:hypothetical protein